MSGSPDLSQWGDEAAQTWKRFSVEASKNFGIAKQWSLQKIGKVKPAPETPEFLLVLEKLNAIRESFLFLETASASAFAVDPTCRNPCKEFIRNQIEPAMVTESRYRTTRLDYDARTATVSDLTTNGAGGARLQKATRERQLVEDQLNGVKRELEEWVQEMENLKDEAHDNTVELVCSTMRGIRPQWEFIGAAAHASSLASKQEGGAATGSSGSSSGSSGSSSSRAAAAKPTSSNPFSLASLLPGKSKSETKPDPTQTLVLDESLLK